jgi:hypothetical protein
MQYPEMRALHPYEKCIFTRILPLGMVLEESLDFNHDDDADVFIRFLKSKGCPATKMRRDIYSKHFVIRGEIGNMIAMLEEIAREEKSVSAEPPMDVDSLARHLSNPVVSSSEKYLNAPLIKSSINAYNLGILTEKRDFVADIMARYTVGEKIASSEEVHAIYSPMADAIRNDPDKEFPEESRQALMLFGKYAWMKENGLISIEQSGVTLLKKSDPETIPSIQAVPTQDMYDGSMLDKHHVCLYRSIFFKISTRVALDPRVHFVFSPKDLGEALVGLAADEKSMERLLINMIFKQYLIGRITGIVRNAKTISREGILLEMRTERIENDWRDCPTEISASPDFVSGIITHMRKAGILAGSNEKIRLA